MEVWYSIVDTILPLSCFKFIFMKNALLALLLVCPLFGVLGTGVINNRMAFFSDVLGHSSLTGIALGIIFGLHDPLWAMIVFACVLAVLVNLFQGATRASSDTVLGVVFAVVVATGIILLNKHDQFSKFSYFLIGDILTVEPHHLRWLGILCLIVSVCWYVCSNALMVISINPVVARTRNIHVKLLEIIFSVLLALVVASCIRLVGILIINSLLVLPAASARTISWNYRSYTLIAVLVSLLSGVTGLIASYYFDTASSATIVVSAALCYAVCVSGSAMRKILPVRLKTK